MLRESLVFLSRNRAARAIVTHAPFARNAARRFVAGETVDDGIAAAGQLNEQGLAVSIDYLGESVHSRQEAQAAADVMLRVVDRIETEKLNANISIKLTQMGQDVDPGFLRENVSRLVERAAAADMFVRFDMESSAYVQRTLDFFREMWDAGHHNIGIVLQAYFFRSAADVAMANGLGARVRLCKGAYVEPPELAYQDKPDVDRNYVELMKLLLEHGTYPAIATHDPAMIRATREFAKEMGRGLETFEFQMLYGVRRDLQLELAKNGYNVRVYVPFGEAWYPYLMRRMAERPANMFFIVNNVIRESPLGRLGGRRNGRG
jgi:proline dehydrogenase